MRHRGSAFTLPTAALAAACLLGAASPDNVRPGKPVAPGAPGVSAAPAATPSGAKSPGAKPPGAKPSGYQRPPKVFEKVAPGQAVEGAITRGDGSVASGEISTKYGQPLVIFDRAKKRFIDFQLPEISRIDVAVEEEHEEPFWYWKEGGGVKVYTGKTYPWRKYLTTVTLHDGTKLEGDLSAPIHIKDADGQEAQLILYKHQKGDEGQKPTDLSYVKSIVLAPQAAGAPGSAAGDQMPQPSTASDGPTMPDSGR